MSAIYACNLSGCAAISLKKSVGRKKDVSAIDWGGDMKKSLFTLWGWAFFSYRL